MSQNGTVPTSLQSSRAAARNGIESLARLGYFAKGAVYGMVGVLTTMTAFGFAGGRITGSRGAIGEISNQPFGQLLLVLVAIGLAGFVVWRVIQAVKDPEGHGRNVKGIVKRVGLLVSGIIYGGLALFALRLLMRSGANGSGDGSQESAGWLMSQTFGTWLVGLVGMIVIGVALFQLYRAVTGSYRRQWDVAEMSPKEFRWAARLCAVGIAARAAALALIGWFFIVAALQADPSEADGLAGALRTLAGSDFGSVWLAAIGLGFICYGIYCFVNGRYKRIRV